MLLIDAKTGEILDTRLDDVGEPYISDADDDRQFLDGCAERAFYLTEYGCSEDEVSGLAPGLSSGRALNAIGRCLSDGRLRNSERVPWDPWNLSDAWAHIYWRSDRPDLGERAIKDAWRDHAEARRDRASGRAGPPPKRATPPIDQTGGANEPEVQQHASTAARPVRQQLFAAAIAAMDTGQMVSWIVDDPKADQFDIVTLIVPPGLADGPQRIADAEARVHRVAERSGATVIGRLDGERELEAFRNRDRGGAG